uniref:Putative conserved secreted protein n=1 Tax=Lutzomyia longipalpis TaxID=7200 RepID=A0A1B0CVG9_LUTLO
MKKPLSLLLLLLIIGQSLAQTETEEIDSTMESTSTNPPYMRMCNYCIGNLKSECAYYQPENSTSIPCPGDNEGSYEKCYASVVGELVRRGCATDGFCDHHSCFMCNYNKCNNYRNFAEQKCIMCDSRPGSSEYHPKCKDRAEELPAQNCIVDDIIFGECHVCDSEVNEDLACLSNPANSSTKICQDYGDSCAQLVVANGKTIRGCLQDLDGSTSTFCPSNNCQICSNNNCNSNIFPSDRITCHQCNDEENCYMDMTSIGNVAYPCRNYALDDQCYTVLEGSVVYRGCLSDRTLEKATCDAAGDLCYKCSEQGCNSEAVEVPPEPTERIWCHQCRGNSTSDCAYHQPWTNSAPCTAELKPGEREKCFVGRYGLDTVRGCTGDDFPELFGDKFCDVLECLVCNDWHCNYHSRAEQRCVQCSSSIDDGDYREECLNEPEKVYSWYCP